MNKRATSLPDWIIARAGGRRRFNAQRKRAAAVRRHRVAVLMFDGAQQKDIAQKLGVHRITVYRDQIEIGGLFGGRRCPYCQRVYGWSALFGNTCLDNI